MPNQLPISDTRGELHTTIDADPNKLKPYLNCIRQLVDEARIDIDSDGLHFAMNDTANVSALELDLYGDDFPNKGFTPTSIGVTVSRMRGAIRRARMDSRDELELQLYDEELIATVKREMGDVKTVSNDMLKLINPRSIRETPDIPKPKDLDADFQGITLDVDAIQDVFGHVAPEYQHTVITSEGGDLVISGNTDDEHEASEVAIQGKGDESGDTAMYASSYIEDMLAVLNKCKASQAMIRFADEFPLYVDFSREVDGDVVMDGTYMLAPRIKQV